MKRYGQLIEKAADIDNLYSAWIKARKSKSHKSDVLDYEKDLDAGIMQLQKEILQAKPTIGNYHYFMISDPKKRQICAAAFHERVLHHALMNVCGPVFDKHLIYDTYATRKGKGTYAALERAQVFAKKYQWYIKLDVRKYFDSIDHRILKHQLSKKFKDTKLTDIFSSIIDSYSCSPGKGLPIGNLTSQYFANHYLSFADRYAKENLQIKGYIRYMDDMLLFADDKDSLLSKLRNFITFVEENLSLRLKQPVISQTKYGMNFLSYKIYPHHVRLSTKSKKRFKTKAKKYMENIDTGKWTQATFQSHILPLLAFTEYADSLNFRKNVFRF